MTHPKELRHAKLPQPKKKKGNCEQNHRLWRYRFCSSTESAPPRVSRSEHEERRHQKEDHTKVLQVTVLLRAIGQLSAHSPLNDTVHHTTGVVSKKKYRQPPIQDNKIYLKVSARSRQHQTRPLTEYTSICPGTSLASLTKPDLR